MKHTPLYIIFFPFITALRIHFLSPLSATNSRAPSSFRVLDTQHFQRGRWTESNTGFLLGNIEEYPLSRRDLNLVDGEWKWECPTGLILGVQWDRGLEYTWIWIYIGRGQATGIFLVEAVQWGGQAVSIK